MKELEKVLSNRQEVLNFLKSRFPIYHLSNVFFRDLQYGVMAYLEGKGMKVSYRHAEMIARRFVEDLERAKLLKPVDRQSWTVEYPEFRTPQRKAAAPAKPAATAPAVQRVAGPAAGAVAQTEAE